ncbi:F-box-like/WD repeat-containing protein TBL1X [Gossypium arboreum]|uniref:F-box-like/WD repeat-containing protein TBL1X n=1 Tax=Gossypium arboreum TaxID=29729 RepID=A0A0B0NCB1_GOSAR|nr:F-box-like/WD repeat-containing protein TBL1X [Gossypium arboreum]
MTSITSVELNYLVFRYLQESGYEAGINKCTIDGNLIPPGALITFVQKGLQYLEMEANMSNNDVEMDEDFSFLQPLDIITKDVNQLRQMIKEKRKNIQKDKDKDKEKNKDKDKNKDREVDREHEAERGRVREKERHEKEEREKEREKAESNKEPEKQPEELADGDMVMDQEDKDAIGHEENGTSIGQEPMDIATTSTQASQEACEIPGSDVTILEGHTSEVCACAWSPTGSLLASGSGDSTARIWTIADGLCKSGAQNSPLNVLVLKHVKGRTNEKSKDVTTLDWNGEGSLLATGSYDGQARIWTTNGELRSTLSKHKGPIFSLKWNKKGDYLLTGSFDKTAIVWDVKAEEWKQQFEFHTGPTLDVDWCNNVSFATSSTDHMIYVCKIGEIHPIKTFAGHQGEVNCVKWDPTGSLLASCSDDITAKIWCMKQDKYVHDLREHSKLWDVELGKLLYSLNGHKDPVYSVAFSPNGEYLASGSLDKSMHIWSLKDGKIVKTYTGNGGIFEVCWNKEGDKLAACFANNTLCVLDFRM